MSSFITVRIRQPLPRFIPSRLQHHRNAIVPPILSHSSYSSILISCIQQRNSSKWIQSKPSSPLLTSFTSTNTGICNDMYNIQRQQWRFWNESVRNPIYVAMEEEERKNAEIEKNDFVGRRLREIEATPGDHQTIWASVFLDGRLVNGTQITIPKVNANIDMIKYAVKEKCSEILTEIAAITFQVLPTKYKRKKSRRKLTRKNRILKADVLYDMALHGGESEDAGIIVKAHTRKMQEGNHFTYGTSFIFCFRQCSYNPTHY